MTFPQADIRVFRESWWHRPPWVWVLVLLCFSCQAQAQERVDVPESPRGAKWIQGIVDDYRAQLGISQRVDVAIVWHNALLTSVEPVDDDASTFALRVQESFLAGLSEDEVRAVVAHELGHVWIFTHHPYLQTESLANQIARRIVARDHLVHVYEKLWQRQGTTGDLARLVGD
jgi:peptidase M48-like protein